MRLVVQRRDTKVHERVTRRDSRGDLREMSHEGGPKEEPIGDQEGESKDWPPKKGALREPKGVPGGVLRGGYSQRDYETRRTSKFSIRTCEMSVGREPFGVSKIY